MTGEAPDQREAEDAGGCQTCNGVGELMAFVTCPTCGGRG